MDEWIERNRKYTLNDGEKNFSIDFAGMKFTAADLEAMRGKFLSAAMEMVNLEAGAVKNPDEKRKVTHFTDRAVYAKSALFREVEDFAEAVRSGSVKGSTGKKFDSVVVNGIGGSALGPQFMQFAINGPYFNELDSARRNGYLKVYFLDNTDSSGFCDVASVIDPETSLHLCISKSGGTQETKNNLISAQELYRDRGLDFARHALAITMRGSELDGNARSNGWLRVFEMAESIGGRTSETSIVGHVPAALAGIDFAAFLAGACRMDEWTRLKDPERNPAMMLAAMWYIAGAGRGDRNMVIVPYSDRLILLSRYLQQLVMESLGKELDLDGKVVHQGLNVFGNKGGTDAHAFIQQLNDGRDDFFVTFIEVLKNAGKLPISDTVEMGDYLHGFMEGLGAALRSKGRQVITVKIPEVDECSLGMLIALYERAVALYAEFIHINAFHQPGVQAYKLAAKGVLQLRSTLIEKIRSQNGASGSAAEIASLIGEADSAVEIGNWLDKAAFNCDCVARSFDPDKGVWVYRIK